jgi:hypothetical protein
MTEDYKMMFATIMELGKAFISRAMRWPNIQKKLSLKVLPLKVEPKGWKNNAIKVTRVNMQRNVQEKKEMSLSFWKQIWRGTTCPWRGAKTVR